MEIIAALAVCGGLAATAVVLALQKGAAERERDAAQFKAAGLADERDIAARKLAAMSGTIIKLERLVIAGGGDSRNLLSVLGEHRRLLSEADRGDPTDADDVRSRETPPPTPLDARMPPGVGLLEPRPGDGDSAVDDPRDALARRGARVPGDPIE